MQVGKFWPGDRFHFGYGVELHGAGAQWDHAAIKCVVKVGKLLEVAKHCGFRVVRVEDRVLQIFTLAVIAQLV